MRPISGAQGLVRKRALRLASRGFGNRQIAFTPCRFAVRAFSHGPFARFRKSDALHGGPSVVGALVSRRHRRENAVRRGACGGRVRRGGGRDAVVSRRPASASASPRVPRRRSPPSQLSSPAPPPSNFGPPDIFLSSHVLLCSRLRWLSALELQPARYIPLVARAAPQQSEISIYPACATRMPETRHQKL